MIFNDFKEYNISSIDNGVKLPQMEITKNQKKIIGCQEDSDNFTYLKYLVFKGFKEKLHNGKIDKNKYQIYVDRCKHELEIFNKNGLVDYFLLVYDILNWCDENGIARGIARGSSSASLVLYLLKIINIDPLINNLYFTRFINEARLQSKLINNELFFLGKSLPDLDSDVSFERREEVINYIDDKYKGKTSKISTSIRLSGKILIKDVTKSFLEYTEEEAKQLSDLIERHFGTVEELEKTKKDNKEFKKWTEQNEECYNIATSLELLIRGKGQHPSGIAISYYDINDYIPLELSSNKSIVSSYDMEDVAKLLIKLDILGLKNADINYNVGKAVGINSLDINVNDKSIYEYLNKTDCYSSLFQIESGLGKNTVLKVKPKNIDEISCCVSIGRPGSMSNIDKYVRYVNEGKLESIHPLFDKILSSTANIIIFQEQINEICQEIYKMSAIDADNVRFCIGKKLKDEIKKWEPIIKQKGKENNIPEDITEYFWDICNRSADYLFVKGHGYSYGYMTAINTFYKANYPKEFFLSVLKMVKFEPNTNEMLSQIYKEMVILGIPLYPPHIIKSDIDFKVDNDGIRFGIGTIKGISEKSIEKLKDFRHLYSTKFDIFKAANEAGIPVNILSSLILSGSMDDMLTETRSKTMLEAILWNFLTEKEKLKCIELGEKYNFNLFNIVKLLNEQVKNEKGKPIIKDSRRDTLRRHIQPHMKLYNFNNQNYKLGIFFAEKAYLGFSYSTNLLEVYKEKMPDLINLQVVKQLEEDDYCHFVAEVVETKQWKSREKKTPTLKITCQDHKNSIECLMFNTDRSPNIENCEENNGRLPKENDIIICRGKKKGDAVFAENVSIQEIEYLKRIKDLEKIKPKGTPELNGTEQQQE